LRVFQLVGHRTVFDRAIQEHVATWEYAFICA